MSRQISQAAESLDSIKPEELLERDIKTYLGNVGFVERVMTDVMDVPRKVRKTLLWAGFCFFNLFLLVVLGINQHFILEFFALQDELSQFFFLFLGITMLGGLIGLVLVTDVSWLMEHLPKPEADQE
jgi:hypothetical protein